MTWTVHTQNQDLTLDSSQLLDQLLSKVVHKKARPDHEQLVQALANYLQANGAATSVTLEHLMAIAFTTGYYYRIFLTNNDVEVIDDTTPPSAPSSP